MKALVLGAGGMAGHVIALRFREKGHDVVGAARRELPFCRGIKLDVTDTERLRVELASGGYDVVINAVGILPAGLAKDPSNGIWVNSYFPHWLADATRDLATRILHMSTDCVFSGKDGGGYREDSFRSADDLYGRTKALGELNDEKNLTLRTSIVGPDINGNGAGLFHWFMRQSGQVSGYRRAIWTGVTTLALADAMEAAATQGLTGLYHLVNDQAINKYELLRLFNEIRRTPLSIEPSDAYVADKSLIRTRNDFAFAVPSYREMVASLKAWIDARPELYPWYVE